jgi:hypothetical protein
MQPKDRGALSFSSDLRHAAIDKEFYAIDVAAVVGCGKHNGFCNFIRGASATEGRRRSGEFGIPVYEIRPGIVKTDMTAGVQAKYDELIAEGLLLQPRWGTPEDVGNAAAMLSPGDLAYSTGQVRTVDRGMTVSRL